MLKATVWDAVQYTPEADGEPEIRVRGVLDDAAREIQKIAPAFVPTEAGLANDITASSAVLKVGPLLSVTPFSARTLFASAARFPETGVLRISNEDIAYAYRDIDTQEFYGLTRGYGRSTSVYTTAAAHLAGSKVVDAGYEYAFFNTQLRVFDYLWKTGGLTTQYTNQAVGANASFVGIGSIKAMIRDLMGEYALGVRPVPISGR